MKREEYINFKSKRDFGILYAYYAEHFDKSKHSPFLTFQELITYLPMWGDVINIYNDICKYYDEKFDVRTLTNKEGIIIKYV